ncbi:MAG: hypothetical protein ACI9QV_001238 [Methylophagaceae bacterium]|jgi:hypothetical protein
MLAGLISNLKRLKAIAMLKMRLDYPFINLDSHTSNALKPHSKSNLFRLLMMIKQEVNILRLKS